MQRVAVRWREPILWWGIALPRGRERKRVDLYRLLCQIKDEMLLVLVVSVGHRKNVYD